MSPVGPLVTLVPATVVMLVARSWSMNMDGYPADQQRLVPILYRLSQLAVAGALIWLIVTICVLYL